MNNTPVLFTCFGCGYRTLTRQPNNTFQICPVCHWEDDAAQVSDPDLEGAANSESLRIHQTSFLTHHANDRPASMNGYELDDHWQPLNLAH